MKTHLWILTLTNQYTIVIQIVKFFTVYKSFTDMIKYKCSHFILTEKKM